MDREHPAMGPVEQLAASLYQHIIRFDDPCADPDALQAIRAYERYAFGETLDGSRRGRASTHHKRR